MAKYKTSLGPVLTKLYREAKTALRKNGPNGIDLDNVRFIEKLKAQWAAGDIATALDEAFDMGAKLSFRATSMAHRESLDRCFKQEDALVKARAIRNDTSARDAKIREDVQAILDANPENTLHHAREIVAKKMGWIKYRHIVKRATKGLKKTRKKPK